MCESADRGAKWRILYTYSIGLMGSGTTLLARGGNPEPLSAGSKNVKKGLYTDRVLGGDRDHRRAHGHSNALPAQDPRPGSCGLVQVQPQTVGPDTLKDLMERASLCTPRGIFPPETPPASS